MSRGSILLSLRGRDLSLNVSLRTKADWFLWNRERHLRIPKNIKGNYGKWVFKRHFREVPSSMTSERMFWALQEASELNWWMKLNFKVQINYFESIIVMESLLPQKILVWESSQWLKKTVWLSVVSNNHFLIRSEKAHTHLKYCKYAACTDPSALGAWVSGSTSLSIKYTLPAPMQQ